jgi:hypothetical protein
MVCLFWAPPARGQIMTYDVMGLIQNVLNYVEQKMQTLNQYMTYAVNLLSLERFGDLLMLNEKVAEAVLMASRIQDTVSKVKQISHARSIWDVAQGVDGLMGTWSTEPWRMNMATNIVNTYSQAKSKVERIAKDPEGYVRSELRQAQWQVVNQQRYVERERVRQRMEMRANYAEYAAKSGKTLDEAMKIAAKSSSTPEERTATAGVSTMQALRVLVGMEEQNAYMRAHDEMVREDAEYREALEAVLEAEDAAMAYSRLHY